MSKAVASPPWTTEDDDRLRKHVDANGQCQWETIATDLGRPDWQCHFRWMLHLDPDVNKGPWTKAEDGKLKALHDKHGQSWQNIADELPGRVAVQCRNRWVYIADPHARKSKWTVEEDAVLLALQECYGNKWAVLANSLPGRSANACRTRLMVTLNEAQSKGCWTEEQDAALLAQYEMHGAVWKKVAENVPGRSAQQCRSRYCNALDPSIRRGPWSEEEEASLMTLHSRHGNFWAEIARNMPGRTEVQVRQHYARKNIHRDTPPKEKAKKPWNVEEDALLACLQRKHGNSWRKIAGGMPGRGLKDCRSRWVDHVVVNRAWTKEEDALLVSMQRVHGSEWKTIAQAIPDRGADYCRNRWAEIQQEEQNKTWTMEETNALVDLVEQYGQCWPTIMDKIPNRTIDECRARWSALVATAEQKHAAPAEAETKTESALVRVTSSEAPVGEDVAAQKKIALAMTDMKIVSSQTRDTCEVEECTGPKESSGCAIDVGSGQAPVDASRILAPTEMVVPTSETSGVSTELPESGKSMATTASPDGAREGAIAIMSNVDGLDKMESGIELSLERILANAEKLEESADKFAQVYDRFSPVSPGSATNLVPKITTGGKRRNARETAANVENRMMRYMGKRTVQDAHDEIATIFLTACGPSNRVGNNGQAIVTNLIDPSISTIEKVSLDDAPKPSKRQKGV